MKKILKQTLIFLLLFYSVSSLVFAQTPVDDKVAVLITGWGMPAGYNFHYSWTSHDYPRIGDITEYEGQPCKIGHIGEFPFQIHVGIIPWLLHHLDVPAFCATPSINPVLYDSIGIYRYDPALNAYIGLTPDQEIVFPASIPPGVPITPLKNIKDRFGSLKYPVDPRDGTDYTQGLYQIGAYTASFPNGIGDLWDEGPAYYLRYIGYMAGPASQPEAYLPPAGLQAQDAALENLLHIAFGDRIDVRYGYYTAVKDDDGNDVTRLHDDVAEEFSTEGFTKMLIARETTDFNNYALEFMSGNYIKERLCELGTLDSTEIHMTRQVGRTPEFNTMNVKNLKPFIEKYPEGSTIAMIYVTRGLSWGAQEKSDCYSSAHPWSKEVYFENAFLNYLSWKKAVQKAYGDRYNLVFTIGGADSDIREDNFFTFGLSTDIDLKGAEGEKVFYSIRDAIQFAKTDGINKIIVAPCHWNYDNLDTILRMKEINKLPFTPKADLAAGVFEMTHCEDAAGSVVECQNGSSVAEVTVAPAYSNLADEFAMAYYVVLRGTLEKFGLLPQGEQHVIEASQAASKLDGITLEVTSPDSGIYGAKIVVPADPYPGEPENYTYLTATAVSDPADTRESLWEDTVISISHRTNPPSMDSLAPAGPAVHFGPYRTIVNRDVTITIPYDPAHVSSDGTHQPYVFNHLTDAWEAIEPAAIDAVSGRMTFKTQVLGLFQVGGKKTDAPPALGEGPFVAGGWWPVLSASSDTPTYLKQNIGVLWTFSDDFVSCQDDCTHTAEYQRAGDESWTALTVSSDAAQGYAWVELPITGLINATTYAFRFAVTDCASQSTQSQTYYFRIAASDAPPVITGGPYLATGSWPVLPTSASKAFVLNQDYAVLWTFSDDYASCAGLCTHRARYRKEGDTAWTSLTPVSTDPAGTAYAHATLPVSSLENGTYQFYFDVRDCAGQRTSAPKVYYFKVEADN